jgi:hypothetical protein
VPAAPWVIPADLPAGLPGGEAELTAACDQATAVLYGLTGRRWAGRRTRTIEVFARHTPWWWRMGDLGLRYDASWGSCGAGWGLPALPLMVGGELYNHSACDRPPSIRLPDYPVTAVTEVRIAGAVRDPGSYRLIGDRYLEDGWNGWPTCGLPGDGVMTVTYTHGADPPPAGRTAAARLAAELAKAAAGQPSALPGYVMQRVRQGETIAYLRADLLNDKGRTGLADVDLWLATVNPAGLRRSSRVWSPDTDPVYRTTDTGGTVP